MSVHTESRFIDAPQPRLFDLIADVERYPEFLPMWIDARIYRRHGEVYFTEQEIGLGPIRRRFRTKTTLTFPSRIEVTSTDSLFRRFLIRWDLVRHGDGCGVTVTLGWEVRSFLLQKGIDLLISETARTMVLAFEERSKQDVV